MYLVPTYLKPLQYFKQSYSNAPYYQETGAIFPAVCNYSMCVHVSKVFAHYFQERIFQLKDMWAVAA